MRHRSNDAPPPDQWNTPREVLAGRRLRWEARPTVWELTVNQRDAVLRRFAPPWYGGRPTRDRATGDLFNG